MQRNIHKAGECALKVWRWGAVAICPHKNTANFGGALGMSDETWLKGDLELILRCDALWAIPGWAESKGAKEEVKFAIENTIPVFKNGDEVWGFLEGLEDE